MKTDNELIAEFMGILKVSSKKYLNSPTYCHPVWGDTDKTGLHYHSSWDWLMPVVEKISKDYDFTIKYYYGECTAYVNKQNLEGLEICSYGNFDPSIVNVHKTVLDFIKWHNKNNKI